MNNRLLKSNYVLDVHGEEITQVDQWIEKNLLKDVDYTYTIMNVLPEPCFRYYFKNSHDHLMAVLNS